MLDPREVTTIERVIELLEYNSKDKAPIEMLKRLLDARTPRLCRGVLAEGEKNAD